MPLSQNVRRAYWAVYVTWILLCAILVIALRGSEDPSHLRSTVPEDVAAVKALHYLTASDTVKYRGYEVVNSALYRRKGSKTSSWVVLCGAPDRTTLAGTIIVEVDAATGVVVGQREPVMTGPAENRAPAPARGAR